MSALYGMARIVLLTQIEELGVNDSGLDIRQISLISQLNELAP